MRFFPSAVSAKVTTSLTLFLPSRSAVNELIFVIDTIPRDRGIFVPYRCKFSATLTLILVASPSACSSTLSNFFKKILAMKMNSLALFLVEICNLLS